MIKTMTKDELKKELQTVNQSIANILQYFDDIDKMEIEKKPLYKDSIVREEKRLAILIANKESYTKMLLKLAK